MIYVMVLKSDTRIPYQTNNLVFFKGHSKIVRLSHQDKLWHDNA
jgi:hypothetical protein